MTKKFSSDDMEVIEAVHVSVNPKPGLEYHVSMFESIATPKQFIPAFEAFRDATEHDDVYIYLQSAGGDIDAMDTFLQAMGECAGNVIIRASGNCSSAASIILLRAPCGFTLSEGFSCLIHCGSLGTAGTLNEFRTHSKFYVAHMEKLLSKHYEGFLSKEEIARLLAGEDFFLGPEEFIERYERMRKHFGLEEMEVVAE